MSNKQKSSAFVSRLISVSHRYDKTVALDDVSLEIPTGQMVCLIGPDGVGKSTLLGLISGVRKIQDGKVEVLGGDIGEVGHRTTVCPRIAYMPQGLGRNLYPTLTVYENVDFFGRLFGQSTSERKWRIDELLSSTGLATFADRRVGRLSGGMKQKLGLCCALIHDPDLLILDEPTTGVDPLSRRQFWELIERIRRRRKDISVIIATAYMEEAERFGWIVAMNLGRVMAMGRAEEIKSRTKTTTLEDAFIKLLPQEMRTGYRTLIIPPRKVHDGMPAIEARGLTRRFGEFTAVDSVSFRIQTGEIFGFMGSNGCGKTTTMKMLTGLLPSSEGEAELFGRKVVPKDLENRKRVGYMSQSFSLYTELTVRQNLELHARLFQLPAGDIPQRINDLVDRMDLRKVLDEKTEKLPIGIRQRLSLAVAIIHRPEVLILDEPTSGVDPIARDRFWELLVDLSRTRGVTIFISTHFMNEAERCDRISLMHDGKVLASDVPALLIRSRGVETLEQAFISFLEEAIDVKQLSGVKSTYEEKNEPLHQPDRIITQPSRAILIDSTRLLAFVRRESLGIVRDPIKLLFALLGPLLLMVVLGYGISFDVEDLPYAVLDRDHSPESRKYLDNFSGSIYFEERRPLEDYAELEDRLRNGELRLAIEIPPGFGRDIKSGNQPEVGVWIDGALPFRAETARGYVLGLHDLYLTDADLNSHLKDTEAPPFNIETRFRYNQDMRSVFAIIPGIMAMLLATIPAILTAVGVVREKELGSITNLYATPANRLEFLIGKQLPYVVIGMINFLSLLLMAIFLSGVTLKGSFFALTAGALLYVTSTTGFGLLVSSFTKTQIAALFAAFLITIITSLNFSGVFEPISSLTGGAEVIGETFPTSYFMRISIGTFNKALNFEDLGVNYIVLGVFIISYLLLSISFLKTQES